MAKVSYFNNPNDFIMSPSRYDVYIMDMESTDDVIDLGKQIMQIDNGGYFIFVSNDPTVAHKAAKIRAHYFLTKPYEKEEFTEVLLRIRKAIKEDSIIIKIPQGERRVRINNLNYINIVKRCLCYHLKDGTMFDGQTLRSSFEKAINPLQNNKTFLFLSPSLLINLSEIKIVNGDNVVFENDDVLYVPKKSYEIIRTAWINYNKISE